MPRRTTRRRLRLGTAGVLAGATLLATACQPTPPKPPTPPTPPTTTTPPAATADPWQPINGAIIKTADYRNRVGPITITLTTTRDVEVQCLDNNQVAVNRVELMTNCQNAKAITINGTAAADTVRVNVANLAVTLNLGAGNDIASVRHRDKGVATVNGQDGDDDLYTILDGGSTFASAEAASRISGGNGNDTLRNMGYGGKPAIGSDGRYPITYLDGGPGADLITGSPKKPDAVTADLADTVNLGTGPYTLDLTASTGTDTATITNRGALGSQVAIAGPTPKSFSLPDDAGSFTLRTGAGNDAVTVSGKSSVTTIAVDGGAGTDTLALRPNNPFTWDQAGRKLTQPGATPWSYTAFETVTATGV